MLLNIKNLIVYTMQKEQVFNPDLIHDSLKDFAFVECGSQDSSKIGFISPTTDDNYIHTVQDHSLLIVQREDKILPAEVIKKALQERVNKLEESQNRKLKKVEKAALKDEVMIDLLPRAFTRIKQTKIWINHKDNFIAIDAGSFKKAEDCLALIRKAIGTLAVAPLYVEPPLATTLTDWVKNDKPAVNFIILNDAVLDDPLDGNGTIKAINEDLTSSDIINHIDAGKQVTSLTLSYKERTSFSINTNMVFFKIKLDHSIFAKNEDIEDRDQRLDADFLLVTSELSDLVNDLMKGLNN